MESLLWCNAVARTSTLYTFESTVYIDSGTVIQCCRAESSPSVEFELDCNGMYLSAECQSCKKNC